LRGGLPLIEYLESGHYVGIEARAAVLEEGRRELDEAQLSHKQPVLMCASDPARVALTGSFEFIWAFSVLVHLRDELVDGYLGLVSRTLSDGGEFYANAWLGDHPAANWQGFPVVARSHESYERWAASHGLVVDDIGTLDTLGHRMGSGDNGMMLRFRRERGHL
jgi:SAM-dependent methyltransferase